MKTIIFDVMLNEQYIHTFKYRYNPLFPPRGGRVKEVCRREIADIERKEL